MKKKEILKTIIREFHASEIPSLVKRDVEVPIASGKIISIIGPRRSGKTYFLYQLISTIVESTSNKENILYINFEDERLDLTTEELDLILQAYRELYPEIDLSKAFFFFDEIQNVNGWEKFIRRIYDSITKNIFITGSNSKMLGDEIATSLRGRTLKYEILPLSFEEFLSFKKFKITLPQDFYDSKIKAKVINLFKEYMLWGGFPEIIFQPESIKMRILQEYFDVMIYRDLIERYSIKDTFVLKYFIKRVAETVSKQLSINKIYNEIKSHGLKVGKNILYEFLEYLENAFLIRKIKKKSHSVLRSEFSDRKAYFIDNGILRAIKVFEGQDYGILLENLIFRELYRKSKNLFFHRENKECDFILEDSIPIQVCFDFSDPAVKKREIDGLVECCRRFNFKKGLIITFDEEDVLNVNGYTFTVVPAYKWLLKKSVN